MSENGKTAVLIVAAGRGTRAIAPTGSQSPKQYFSLSGKSVLTRTISRFLRNPSIGFVQVVIHSDDGTDYTSAIKDVENTQKLLPAATGGETRQESVWLGLEALVPHKIEKVLVHDAVRPFVSDETIERVIAALDGQPAILPALSVVDTLKRVEDGMVIETTPREGLWSAQTPQGFHFNQLYNAHQQAVEADVNNHTDDCSVMEAAGFRIHVVEGNPENKKLTTYEDLKLAENQMATTFETRIGNGYDVHAFEDGDSVILGGVKIPHSKKLKGHSDADVLLHTITDAIFGAICDGDIGYHFPPSDPQWKGADSDIFLKYACERLRALGGEIVNVDATLMCESPKVGPHRDMIRQSVADICEIALSRVAIKATTTERLGFTGREEGIACQATVSVKLPEGAL